MYESDTFYHLSSYGQIGLATLSVILSIATIWCFKEISSRFPWFVKLVLAVVFLWMFVWLSPQIYYAYYGLIFDGLPMQIVIQTPPSLQTIFKLATFSDQATLSSHSKGVLFWLLVVSAFIGKRTRTNKTD